MREENILAKIGGDYVSGALKTLPDAETAKEEIQEPVIEVSRFGRAVYLQALCWKTQQAPLGVLGDGKRREGGGGGIKKPGEGVRALKTRKGIPGEHLGGARINREERLWSHATVTDWLQGQ